MTTWTTKLRAPAIKAVLIAVCIAVPCVQAAEKMQPKKASKQETVGVASGFTVGAVAGGPLGAIVGAATGAWLGDRYHRQAVAKSALAKDLSESENERMKLSGTLASAHEQLGQALDRTHNLEAAVSFRTGDAALTAEGAARVKKLGELASALPDTKVRVSGFADPRGSEEYNAQLTQRRADSVAAVLKDAGVDLSRIIIEAYGESQSSTVDGDTDGYAFDRRVNVRIEGGSEALARAQ